MIAKGTGDEKIIASLVEKWGLSRDQARRALADYGDEIDQARRARLNSGARRNAFLLTPRNLAEDNGFIVNGGFVSHRDPMITILFVEKEKGGKRGLVIIRSALVVYGTDSQGDMLAKSAVEGEFLPEGGSRADARAREEVEEWARLNPGVRGARRNADVVRVDRPKGYQSHGWKKERGPGGWEVWPEEQYTYSPDGRFEARSKSYRGAPTGRIYKEYLYKGTYFIKMIDYITGPQGGLTGRATFQVINPDGQVVVIEGTEADARYFADQDVKTWEQPIDRLLRETRERMERE